MSFYDVHRGYDSLEDFGFRIGWVATAQMPLIFLLASRLNLIALLVGLSYEQLSWLHQWAARTFLLSSTLHGIFFMVLWAKAGFFWMELKIMPMVGVGMLAWGVLAWISLSSMLPIRKLGYEFFIFQHIVSAIAFLYLLTQHLKHLPYYNKQLVVWCIAIFALDASTRVLSMLYQSLKWRSRASFTGPRIGYEAEIHATCDDITIITIKGVSFSWKPGQHILVWMPKFVFQTPHPFTISNTSTSPKDGSCQTIQLVVRSKRGFTRRLNTYARQSRDVGSQISLRVLVSPPHGQHHDWGKFATLVSVSVSTGASFSLPIVESILESSQPVKTGRICMLLIAKHASHLQSYRSRISRDIVVASNVRISLEARIFITKDPKEEETKPLEEDQMELLGIGERSRDLNDEAEPKEENQGELSASFEANGDIAVATGSSREQSFDSSTSEDSDSDLNLELASSDCDLQESFGRPDLASYLHSTLEGTKGTAKVTVCGGSGIVADMRNAVARISLRRLLHDPPQYPDDIILHVEEFGL